MNKITELKDEHTPNYRHQRRMKALYVEPGPSGAWNRPADMSEAEARHFLMEAVNDYSGRYNNPELREALAGLPALSCRLRCGRNGQRSVDDGGPMAKSGAASLS